MMCKQKFIYCFEILCFFASLIFILTACGAGSGNDYSPIVSHNVDGVMVAATPAPASMPMPGIAEAQVSSFEDSYTPATVAGGELVQQTRHIIQRADVTLESEFFDAAVTALRSFAPAVHGYVESEVLTHTGLPRLTIVLRIPTAQFDAVLQQVTEVAAVISLSQSAEDVTDRFYDTAGNLATRRIEEERILDLISRTSELNELLALETRLSNVRLTIANYSAQLNQMADQIAYSTITVTLTQKPEIEVAEIVTPPTLGERIGGAFGDSVDGTITAMQNVVVFLAGVIIPLMVLGSIGFLFWQLTKKMRVKQ